MSNIVVTQQPSNQIEVRNPGSVQFLSTDQTYDIEVGGSATHNVFVGPSLPTFSGPGIWIQTGLNGGKEFAVWFEDGS